MAPKGKQGLTHDEIWDDSALVDSWNEALEEYKKYHSIHVKGGNVEDLINENNNTSDAKHEVAEQAAALHSDEPPKEVKVKQEQDAIQNASHGSHQDGTRGIRHSHSPAPGPAPGPAGLLGTVRDEGLKRLLMSWYYAGYYTGYYEGRNEGQRERQQQQNGEGEKESGQQQ